MPSKGSSCVVMLHSFSGLMSAKLKLYNVGCSRYMVDAFSVNSMEKHKNFSNAFTDFTSIYYLSWQKKIEKLSCQLQNLKDKE